MRVAIPLAFTVLFLMSVLMTSGYLLQGTATEKENKVVEVLLASANPDEILAGKLIGLGAAGLLQVAVWMTMLFVTGFGAIPLLFAAQVDVPWRTLVVALPLFMFAFLFFGSLMLGTGSLGSNMREAQQLSMMWSLTAALPLMLMSVLLREPHGLVVRVMTWLPLTAAPVIVMRVEHGRRLPGMVGDRRADAAADGRHLGRHPDRRPPVPRRPPQRRRQTELPRGDPPGATTVIPSVHGVHAVHGFKGRFRGSSVRFNGWFSLDPHPNAGANPSGALKRLEPEPNPEPNP